MKRLLIRSLPAALLLVLMTLIYTACTESIASGNQSSVEQSDTDKRVEEIMSKMDLRDKVGEMTQFTIDVISKGQAYSLDEPHTLDTEKLYDVLVNRRAGSILNSGGHAYTREHWHEIMTTIQDYAMNQKKSGIPVLYGIDAIHGTNYTLGSTLFPQQIGLAATFNPDLARITGEVTAYETRASYIPWTFSPVQDLGRDPRWPRVWETFGEDVYLIEEMGKAMIEGYEGEGDEAIDKKYKVASCLKHFLGYSMPLSGKDRTPAWIPERQLLEYFVPPFEAGINAGAESIMVCSGEMNGIPVHVNEKILTTLVREDLQFKGVLVTDWKDIGYLVKRHRVAKDYREAVKMAINAGIDMAMVPDDTTFTSHLYDLARTGEVPMSRINESVARVLRMKIRLGLFENPVGNPDDYPDFASEESAQASLEAALESLTLLKNEKNTLPLKANQQVFLTGPTADNMMPLNGGWTRTWQGNNEQWDTETDKQTIREALTSIYGNKLDYAPGTSFDEEVSINTAVGKARSADVIVVCVGEFPYTEKLGDIDDLYLPDVQYKLVKELAKLGKPMVLVMVGGRPRILTPIMNEVDALLMCYLPGNEGGRAAAKILAGQANPSGKLPITYPRFPNALERYDHKGTDIQNRDYTLNGFNPLYPFGFGLSYTSFDYSGLQVVVEGETLKVTVNIKNTGDREGKESVLVYVQDKVASITPPVRRLRDFKKIELASGESKQLNFDIPISRLAFVGRDNKWILEPGAFEVQVGALSTEFTLH